MPTGFTGIGIALLALSVSSSPVTVFGQTFDEFPIPTPESGPWGIAAGPDGALWFTETATDTIGRITTSGVITEFNTTFRSGPTGIAAGPDGALWFIEGHHGAIAPPAFGRITTTGIVTEFTGPTPSRGPYAIAAGPDGALWFTELNNKIGRITTAGVVTEFAIPTPGSSPSSIAAGPDGALWFTESSGNKIGRITTAGVITEFTVPTAVSEPTGIAAGPDGALWFTESSGNKIGRITTAGVITEFTVPTADGGPTGIAAGPDGALWFTEHSGKIGRISLAGMPCESSPAILCLNNGRFRVQTRWTTPDGQSSTGQAVGLTSDTGYFWFFSADNVEMVVKVVDGRAFNSRYWVFAGGLTNVNVVMTVTDTQTGAHRTYINPQGEAFQPIQDTDAFADSTTAAPNEIASAGAFEAGEAAQRTAAVSTASVHAPCVSDATTLCLNNGRFRVQTQWATPDGQSGAGQAVGLTSDTGFFWFFSADNVEMVVKAVTGCTFNSRYWVFAGGLTNVNVVMTVTDTQTEVVKTYTNPQSTAFQPIQDTDAFASCPTPAAAFAGLASGTE